ncbi:hypothetical protein [Zavarzinella formosa]|uniref:hypothetical protein n=1 Tax=Zavarzinella formosa TaxID=360055 RepID=UPI0002D38F41|nr:hypothetical protein [Zavarzinella formosa]
MTNLPDALALLSRGDARWVAIDADGRVSLTAVATGLIVPGSFNPLHAGHTELAAIAERRFSRPASFEISLFNVDKPELPPEEVIRRTSQFQGRATVILTRSPTFAEKAGLFPASIFVVGADTAGRVIDPRYYGHDHAMMLATLTAIRGTGCRFLVGGRSLNGGPFTDLACLPIPESHADLFEGIPETEFRVDLSSTQLRIG